MFKNHDDLYKGVCINKPLFKFLKGNMSCVRKILAGSNSVEYICTYLSVLINLLYGV